MVVIEPEESNEHIVEKEQTKISSPAEDLRGGTSESAAATPTATAEGGDGDASDGFETASERGVSDGEEGEGNGRGTAHNGHDREQQREPQPHTEAERRDEGQELPERRGDSDHDGSKQKALSQANDAKLEGNQLFGEGQYEEALLKYELALQIAADIPDSTELRSICHANRAICFQKLGKYQETIKECSKALELNPSYGKALLRRGEAHEKLENYEEAIADFKKILELGTLNDQARRSICRLEPLAAEKREKMKEEMIAKLKEMGNSVLGRFGMSVDNFKAVRDPNTGSYSISFQR